MHRTRTKLPSRNKSLWNPVQTLYLTKKAHLTPAAMNKGYLEQAESNRRPSIVAGDIHRGDGQYVRCLSTCVPKSSTKSKVKSRTTAPERESNRKIQSHQNPVSRIGISNRKLRLSLLRWDNMAAVAMRSWSSIATDRRRGYTDHPAEWRGVMIRGAWRRSAMCCCIFDTGKADDRCRVIDDRWPKDQKDELVRRLICLGHGCKVRESLIGGSLVANCDGETVTVRVGDLDLTRRT